MFVYFYFEINVFVIDILLFTLISKYFVTKKKKKKEINVLKIETIVQNAWC
jgi:hypothetical protein